MKYKTSELTGAMLDAAVAKASGLSYAIHPQKVWGDGYGVTIVNQTPACWTGTGYYEPSTDWRTGGPIIDLKQISLIVDDGHTDACVMLITDHGELAGHNGRGEGPTPLIAAMRAYVASKFGEEVDL